jgi:hypothetical protein
MNKIAAAFQTNFKLLLPQQIASTCCQVEKSKTHFLQACILKHFTAVIVAID